jgi:hypothetical protein
MMALMATMPLVPSMTLMICVVDYDIFWDLRGILEGLDDCSVHDVHDDYDVHCVHDDPNSCDVCDHDVFAANGLFLLQRRL